MSNPPEAVDWDWVEIVDEIRRASVLGPHGAILGGIQAFARQLRPTPPGTPEAPEHPWIEVASAYDREQSPRAACMNALRTYHLLFHGTPPGTPAAIMTPPALAGARVITGPTLPPASAGDLSEPPKPEPAPAVGETCVHCGRLESEHLAERRCWSFVPYRHYTADPSPALRARVAEQDEQFNLMSFQLNARAQKAEQQLAAAQKLADERKALLDLAATTAGHRETDLRMRAEKAERERDEARDQSLRRYNESCVKLANLMVEMGDVKVERDKLRAELSEARAEVGRFAAVCALVDDVMQLDTHTVRLRFAGPDRLRAFCGALSTYRTAAEKQEKSE